jgi:hypothetical protein
VEAAGDIEEALALQQCVLWAEEEPQRVFGALSRGQPVAEVMLVTDGKQIACGGIGSAGCVWPDHIVGEVERRLALQRHASLTTEGGGERVAAPIAHRSSPRAQSCRMAVRKGDRRCRGGAGRAGGLEQHQVVRCAVDRDPRLLDAPAIFRHELTQRCPPRARGADIGVVDAVARHRDAVRYAEQRLGRIGVFTAARNAQAGVAVPGDQRTASGGVPVG